MGVSAGALGALLASALVSGQGAAQAAALPVTVECLLKVDYSVHADRSVSGTTTRYGCEARVVPSSDVEAVDVARRQVLFALGRCPWLPRTVAFSGQDVTAVREVRQGMVRAHLLAGECAACVIVPNADIAGRHLDSAHFDATFLLRPLERGSSSGGIVFPGGEGDLTLRSAQTDDVLVRAPWVARRCEVVEPLPTFCGGIGGILCPAGMVCVDWPGDDCDPEAGGADCIGVCVPAS